MFKSYFVIAYRNILRHKFHSFINVFGLMLGLTSCIMIMLYVLDEFGFDQWVPDADNVYRLEMDLFAGGRGGRNVKTGFRSRADLIEYFPEVKAATRLIDSSVVLRADEEKYLEKAWFVDENFFEVIDLPLMFGDKNTALRDKYSMLISASMAAKYFADEPAVGQVLLLDDQREYQVVAVFQDIPEKSHLDIDFLIPYDENDALYGFGYSADWLAIEPYTYVSLVEGADYQTINSRFPQFLDRYFPSEVRPENLQISMQLNNIQNIHLDPEVRGSMKPAGNRQMLITLSLIALLILVIACINFVNLSVIKSLGRAKEISVRKVVGANKSQLTFQFLCETVLVSMLALGGSIALVDLLLPLYNELLGREFSVFYFSTLTAFIEMVFVVGVLAMASGLYPAYRLSSWQPAKVLRAGFSSSQQKTAWLQPVLVMLQFAISIALLITTAVIFFQQSFVASKDLGFLPQNKLVIRNMDEDFSRNSRQGIATELARIPAVTGTAFSVATPSDSIEGFTRQVAVPGRVEDGFSLFPRVVDSNFFSIYGVQIRGGREFSRLIASDQFSWDSYSLENGAELSFSSVILNSTAVQRVGFRDSVEAIGETIVMGNVRFEIIGVVSDFYFRSLRSAITPDMYIYSPENHIALTVSYAQGSDVSQLTQDVTEVWDQFVPGFPAAIEFVEANVEAQYAEDRLQFLLMTIFSSLAITIACMGLYALSAYSSQQRTREIGIRKIHGALSMDIIKILLLQFSKPILIANFLAWPLALYAINSYLNGYQYRIELGPLLFIASSLAALAIAWLAIAWHAIGVANSNPVEAIRYG